MELKVPWEWARDKRYRMQLSAAEVRDKLQGAYHLAWPLVPLYDNPNEEKQQLDGRMRGQDL